MRLPNGFGGIAKLSGKRRNPWRARITSGWTIDEKTQKAKQVYITIGYYPTRQLALQALSEYNTNPYDLDANKVTFAEVYEKWAKKKFDEHFKDTEYTTDTYGALNYDKEDEERKEYQTFVE